MALSPSRTRNDALRWWRDQDLGRRGQRSVNLSSLVVSLVVLPHCLFIFFLLLHFFKSLPEAKLCCAIDTLLSPRHGKSVIVKTGSRDKTPMWLKFWLAIKKDLEDRTFSFGGTLFIDEHVQ